MVGDKPGPITYPQKWSRTTNEAMSLSRRLPAVALCLLAACAGQPPDDDAGLPFPVGGGGGSTPPVVTWSACQVPQQFVITRTSLDGGCSEAPRVDELISLQQTSDVDGLLRVGADELPVRLDATCAIRGASCSGLDGGAGEWLKLDLQLQRSSGVWQANLSRERSSSHRSTCATAGQLALNVVPGCFLDGTWSFTMPPTLTQGACSTTWSAPLVISDGGISFSGTRLPLEVDLSSCRASGRRGAPDAGSWWLWNGVSREARVEVSLEGTRMTGRIDDALDGVAFGNIACDGGVFTFTAERPSRPTTPLPTSCEAARPWLDRNGTCEVDAGETCTAADCACPMALSCREDRCVKLCQVDTECGANERCGAGRFCIPEGTVDAGLPCARPDDCRTTFTCGPALGTDAGVCVPRCDPFAPTPIPCPENSECRNNACFAYTPLGGPCRSATECVAVNGERACVGFSSTQPGYCSQRCITSSCPASLPVCELNYCRKP